MTLISIVPSRPAGGDHAPWTALPLVIAFIVAAGCGAARPVGVAPTDGSATTPGAGKTVTTTSLPTLAPTTAKHSGLLAMTLTDVRSGQTFSLAQFEGKVTIVQHMAVW